MCLNKTKMFLENIEIIVGTYQEYSLGYKPKHVDEVFSLTNTFASHDHKASIRCVASSGKLIASGGADDTVIVFDMAKRKVCGHLMHHNGTVNCIAFSPDGSHLLTGGDDGMLAIVKVPKFRLEKTWGTAHKGSVLDISVHPTGKLALSVGADGTLRTWNLVNGRKAYAKRLGSAKSGAAWQITGVCWSPDGRFYVLVVGSIIDVYSVETASVVYTFTTEMKVTSFCFLSGNRLCIGCENGMFYVHDLENKHCLMEKKVHEQRVKCLKSVESLDCVYIVSASSSGELKLWEYMEKTLRELCEVNTGCRITSLTIATCGYPENFQEEDDTDIKIEKELEDYLQEINKTIPLKTREVVEVEVEDGKNPHKTHERRTKRKRVNNVKNSLEIEEGLVKPAKKQKVMQSEVRNSFRMKHKKNKKRKKSLPSSWEVSDVVR